MKIIIADIITELHPKYEETIKLAEPFVYQGERSVDVQLNISDKYLNNLMSRAAKNISIGERENFAFSCEFNRKAINYNTMLVHLSALVYDGGAYLFSADLGVVKSTHTKLWLKAFGDKVHIVNDDKPVVRLYDDQAKAFGTPFDGGSGIAHNENYPLKAIIFVERGEKNSVRIPTSREIIQKRTFKLRAW